MLTSLLLALQTLNKAGNLQQELKGTSQENLIGCTIGFNSRFEYRCIQISAF